MWGHGAALGLSATLPWTFCLANAGLMSLFFLIIGLKYDQSEKNPKHILFCFILNSHFNIKMPIVCLWGKIMYSILQIAPLPQALPIFSVPWDPVCSAIKKENARFWVWSKIAFKDPSGLLAKGHLSRLGDWNYMTPRELVTKRVALLLMWTCLVT